MYRPYGTGGTPQDLGRMPAMRPRQAHSLRTGPRDDGWRSAGGVRSNKRKTVKVDPVSNLVAPVADVDDDAPVRKYVRTDYAAERRLVGTIKMSEF